MEVAKIRNKQHNLNTSISLPVLVPLIESQKKPLDVTDSSQKTTALNTDRKVQASPS